VGNPPCLAEELLRIESDKFAKGPANEAEMSIDIIVGVIDYSPVEMESEIMN
jgi:hypothetical protein